MSISKKPVKAGFKVLKTRMCVRKNAECTMTDFCDAGFTKILSHGGDHYCRKH